MNKALTIGVDIGGTRTKYGLVNLQTGEVLHSLVHVTEQHNAAVFVQQVQEVVETCRMVAAQRNDHIAGIGFGVPGYISTGGVVATTYGFLAFMEDYPLQHIIEQQFDLPCLLDNDARVVGLGEALYGKGVGYQRVLTLTLGTGVGFGFVANEKLSEPLPLAHMGGHIKINDEGAPCYCGKKGCLEALVSSTGIINLAKQYGLPGAQSAEVIFTEAANGNANAVSIVTMVTQYLHHGIHNYVNLFAPDMIVLGGGIAKGLAPYLAQIKAENYLGPFPGFDFKLEVSALHEQAGMLGSAALFHHQPKTILHER